VTDVPDWTQSVNIQNAEIPVAGGVTIDAGQSGVGVFVGSLEYPQLVNSGFRLSEWLAFYPVTVPLFTLTTSIGVVVYPAIPPNFAVGTTVTVSVVGGITGVVYADEVQLQYGEGAQVTVAISGALEVTAVVTVTYSTPSLISDVPCFFIGIFGPLGPLAVPHLPAPPTAGWVNMQSGSMLTKYFATALTTGGSTTIIAGALGETITVWGISGSLSIYTLTGTGLVQVAALDTTSAVVVASAGIFVQTAAGSSAVPFVMPTGGPIVLPLGAGLQLTQGGGGEPNSVTVATAFYTQV
jgi:hypothetical protein